MIFKLSPLLCYLSDNEPNSELCSRYWALDASGRWNEKFNTLAEGSAISRFELLALLKASCRVRVTGLRCQDCGSMPEVQTRTEYLELTTSFAARVHAYQCTHCAGLALAAKAVVDEMEDQAKMDCVRLLLAIGQADQIPFNYAAMPYVEAFLLYSVLVSAGECWKNGEIGSLRSQFVKLSATDARSSETYLRLHAAGVLSPSPSSKPSAFEITGEGIGELRFLPEEVDWTLAPDANGLPLQDLLGELEKKLDQRDDGATEAL